MNWKKGFIGLSVFLVVFGAFSIYKVVDTNNGMEEIENEIGLTMDSMEKH